jgi:choline dehydrogenase-like flavoprotein
MYSSEYEYIIVGSGIGGAAMAKELAERGKSVLLIEKGKHYSQFGNIEDIVRFYEVSKLTKRLRYSEEGVMLLRTFMAGGTSVVSCGNGVRCLEKELADLGVDLEAEFTEAELEMGIAPISKSLLSHGSQAIIVASEELGYRMELMPKFINPALCTSCGHCCAGCQSGAKWSAMKFLQQARQSGANIIYGNTVRGVLVKNGKAKGVFAEGPEGQIKILSDRVILCAGALTTPLILQQSGIEDAGTNLFVDTYVNVYGITTGLNQIREPPMALINREFYHDEGFVISPFVNHFKICRFAELGAMGLTIPLDKLLGLMVKIQDESSGFIFPDGAVSKKVTYKDQLRLNKGSAIAKEILTKAGADHKSLMISRPQGPHPGGTAAIGRIVNSDLETKIENLFVCDASVLPTSPGLPLILTIAALAKRLAKRLV